METLSMCKNVYVASVFFMVILCVLIIFYSESSQFITQSHYTPSGNYTNHWNSRIGTAKHVTDQFKSVSNGNRQISFHSFGNFFENLTGSDVISVHSSSHGIFNYSNTCSGRAVRLSEKALPVTGLVSFPGSGNTWLRHLIQQMTGIATSSVYCDATLARAGFPFECETKKNRTTIVKTHEAEYFHLFEKIVLLVRNPFDALLSWTMFSRAGHTDHPTLTALKKASSKMFEHSLLWYKSLLNQTIQTYKGPVHVVQYERLDTNKIKELRGLAAFLNVTVSSQDMDCTVIMQEGNFHRNSSQAKHIELLRTIYDKEKVLKLRDTAVISQTLLKQAYTVDLDLCGPLQTLFEDVKC